MNVSSSSENTYTSASYSNKGISGLASGMDTEGLVKSMLSGAQTKIDKQEQQQQVLEWQQEEYREVIDKINEFKDKYLSATSDDSIIRPSTFKNTTTESSSSAVKATATTKVVTGDFTVNVTKLAKAASCSNTVSGGSAISISSTSDIAKNKANKDNLTISLGTNNVSVDISGATSNKEIVDLINSGIEKNNRLVSDDKKINVVASLDKDNNIVYSGTNLKDTLSISHGAAALSGTTEKTGSIVTSAYNKENKITLSSGDDTLEIDLSGKSDIAKAINDAISADDKFKTKNLSVALNSGKLEFKDSSGTKTEFTVSGTNAGLASVGLSGATTSKDGTLTAANAVSVEQNKITVNGKDITLTADDTSETIVKKINDLGITDFTASLSGGAISISGKDTVSNFKITGAAADLAKFGLDGEKSSDVTTNVTVKSDAVKVESLGKLNFNLNGVTKNIEITKTDNIDSLRNKLTDAFGSRAVTIDDSGNFVTGTGQSLTLSGDKTALDFLGIKDDKVSNYFDASESLSKLFSYGDNDVLSFSINNVDFSFKASTSLNDVISEVNESRAGVTITYNSLNSSLSMKTNETGKIASIDAKDNTANGLLSKMFGGDIHETGSDAELKINGEDIVNSNNDIEYNGVSLSLKEVTNGNVTISTAKDTDKTYSAIETFVNDYNKLIEDLNKRIHEEATYKKYAPLTDAQKDEMSDDEIKKWEEKSKTGLLSKDNDISNFLQDMRKVLYSKVGNVGTLSDIGIDSSSEWKDYGKLKIDKAKLKEAINSDSDKVASLFTGSDGIASKLSTACKKAAGTSSGSPGFLVSLAGVKGKATEKNNTMTNRIDAIKEKIKALKEKYDAEKEKYWKQFNSMETTLNNMNSTASWLGTMLGG